ncbi:hypothetical protein MRX96_033671 [Rhipicephalus microplus]
MQSGGGWRFSVGRSLLPPAPRRFVAALRRSHQPRAGDWSEPDAEADALCAPNWRSSFVRRSARRISDRRREPPTSSFTSGRATASRRNRHTSHASTRFAC